MLDLLLTFITFLPQIAVVVAVILVVLSPRRQRSSPPGPPVLPVIGNLNQLTVSDVRDRFDELRKEYGDIFSVFIGRKPAVVICGYDTLYETFVKNGKHTSGRNLSFFYDHLTEGGKGVFWSTGERWHRSRSFALQSLVHLEKHGTMEEKISEELRHFSDYLTSLNGNAIDCHDIVYAAMTNISYSLLISKRYEYPDKDFQTTVSSVYQATCAGQTAINMFPALKHVPFDLVGFHGAAKRQTKVRETLVREISRRSTESRSDDVKDCLNYFHMKCRSTSGSGDLEKELPFIFQDLLVAGGNTTGNALCWGILYLLNHPYVVSKIKAELYQHIGSSRKPKLSDRTVLHYTNAACHEINRYKTITPLSVPHSNTEAVTIKGYVIPKGCTIIPHLQTAFSDHSIWEDASSFKPEHFLDENGHFREKKEHIPFFLGPRKCPGESLAEQELFLFVSAIIQQFEILPEDQSPPPIKGTLHKTFNSDSYQVRFVPRGLAA